MTNSLQWTERDGYASFSATGLGFKYEINPTYSVLPWEIWITWNENEPDSETENDVFIEESPTFDLCKRIAQSHHNAICKAVEEAVNKAAKVLGSNMTSDQILFLP